MSGPWLEASPGVSFAAIVLAAVLLGFGLAGERGLWRRGRSTGPSWARWAPVIAWSAAVLGGVLLVVRPLGRSVPSGTEALLLTEGAASAAAGESNLTTARAFVVVGPASGSSNIAAALPIVDARALWRDEPGLAAVTVRGYGLDRWDWSGFSGTVRFEPASLPAGVARAFWPRRLALGEAFEVEGSVVAPTGAKVILEGPGGPEDERAVNPSAAPVPFRLRGLPRTHGRQLYTLRALALSGTEIEHESLDVVVEPAALPAVLVLESAPRFETRYLKDWLTGIGARFAVRSTISKDRFRSESPAVPSPAGAVSVLEKRLDRASLAPFDVVMADPSALDALSAAERTALAAAIDQGMGLLVALPRGVGIEHASFAVHPPEVRTVPGLDLLAARSTWPGGLEVPALDIEARELVGGEPLIADPSGRRLAVALRRGRGTLVWSVLHDTYRYVLEGNASAHRALWSRLLSAAARPRDQALRWRAPMGPVLVDRPLDVALETPAEEPRAALREGGADVQPVQALALQEDLLDPSRWSARLWPRRAGWFHLEADAEHGLDIYSAAADAWPTWRAAERSDATRRAAETSAGAAGSRGDLVARRPLPQWPFFGLLLAGLSWLWIDERLRG